MKKKAGPKSYTKKYYSSHSQLFIQKIIYENNLGTKKFCQGWTQKIWNTLRLVKNPGHIVDMRDYEYYVSFTNKKQIKPLYIFWS